MYSKINTVHRLDHGRKVSWVWRLARLCSSHTSHSRNYSNIEVSNVEKVRVISLNRPKDRNAVNRSTARELYHAFKSFDSDPSSHVAVLHGNGGTFCAGYDLKELADAGTDNQQSYLNEFFKECDTQGDDYMGPMVSA